VEVKGRTAFSYEGMIFSKKPKDPKGKPWTTNIPAKFTIPLFRSLEHIIGDHNLKNLPAKMDAVSIPIPTPLGLIQPPPLETAPVTK
jgi:hypothetical protein